ncbi:hypothetical protein QR680_017682 [Steinernema hermaphroditum]|uniref:Sodium/hydrogen exchanger n=1 Tax=Steinernema hermaphroditum TaxID=289476 RepID=A0AA39HFG6_9BILA|nr:hypothetical protein QR680_017682 [Steinernema hermaphroditum]
MKWTLLIPAAIFLVALAAAQSTVSLKIERALEHEQSPVSNESAPHGSSEHKHHGVKVASFKFDYVKQQLVLTGFIVLIGLFKLVYHKCNAELFFPESCCLILLGMLFGFIVHLCSGTVTSVEFLKFDSRTFFFYLLPPIILESAYSLKDREFVDNFGTILLYAVVGTVLNIALIGGGLIAAGFTGLLGSFVMNPLDCLIFASLIAAVDPVAVLAIFQEVGVNKMLYFMVFGESLLNDAVTVVCYNLVNDFKELDAISITDCLMGIVAFGAVSLGALTIGLFFGALSAFITRFTQTIKVVEPIICLGVAYLAYICSELFHFSGIIGIIACGLFQAHYTMRNLSPSSVTSVNQAAKVSSSLSESLIFIILGVMFVNEKSLIVADWHPWFTAVSLILCGVARFVVVFFLTYIVNKVTGGARYINVREQLIMAYGGLRGAVSFSLAFMLTNAEADIKNTILAATYIIILFTVMIQGCTIKFLVKLLNIRLAAKEEHYRLFIQLNNGTVNYMTLGIEEVLGYKGFKLMSIASELSSRFLRKWLHNDWTQKCHTDRLILLNHEETVKESLNTVPSSASFQRPPPSTPSHHPEEKETVIEMSHEEEPMLRRRRANTEREVSEMTKDAYHIQQLINSPFNKIHDRNMVGEEARQQQQRDFSQHIEKINKMAKMNDMHVVKERRNIFGKPTFRKKMSVTKGVLIASFGSLGVGNQSVDASASSDGIMHLDEPAVIPEESDLYGSQPQHVEEEEAERPDDERDKNAKIFRIASHHEEHD